MGIVKVTKEATRHLGGLVLTCTGEPCIAPGGRYFNYTGGSYADRAARAGEDGFKTYNGDKLCNWCRVRAVRRAEQAIEQRKKHLNDIVKVCLEQKQRYGYHTKVVFIADYALEAAQKELETLG